MSCNVMMCQYFFSFTLLQKGQIKSLFRNSVWLSEDPVRAGNRTGLWEPFFLPGLTMRRKGLLVKFCSPVKKKFPSYCKWYQNPCLFQLWYHSPLFPSCNNDSKDRLRCLVTRDFCLYLSRRGPRNKAAYAVHSGSAAYISSLGIKTKMLI